MTEPPLVEPDRRPPRRTLEGLVAGVSAAVVALGVAELVASLSASWRSPVLDVGDRVIDLVPSPVKELAIDWFGTADKAALLIGIGVLLTVYACVVGVVALRGRHRLGMAGVAVFGLVGALAALGSREDRPVTAVLPSLVGAVAGAASLRWLCLIADRDEPATDSSPTRAERGPVMSDQVTTVSGALTDRRGEPDEPDPTGRSDLLDRSVRPSAEPASRRAFLGASALLVVVGAAAATGGRWLGARFSAAAARAQVVLPKALRPLPPIPAATSLDVEGISPLSTPNDDFYRIDTALTVPQVDPENWTLRIDGMVERPLEMTYEQLLARDMIEADITLTCVSNEVGGSLVGNARWLGVRLDELLDEVGVSPRADQVVGRSVDGYTCGFPVGALDGRDALVAVAMNGEPLPVRHGFPARLVVPGLYGYVSATKWLRQIELTRFDAFDQYWVPRGWAVEGPIKTSSRIDTPKGLARIPAGRTAVAGVAWAQTRGIDKVEVKVDDGPWQEAQLAEQLSEDSWRQWMLPWQARPGQHTLTVRATDGTGAIQTAERSEPIPNGSSGLHQIVVMVDD